MHYCDMCGRQEETLSQEQSASGHVYHLCEDCQQGYIHSACDLDVWAAEKEAETCD